MTPPRAQDRRRLSALDLLLLVLNTVVGAGIVALPARAYAAAGGQVFLALLAAGCAAGVIALAFARLAARFPGPGGPYLYARLTLGPQAGWIVAACLVPTRVLATAASLNILSAALRPWAGPQLATTLTLAAAAACTLLAERSVSTPIRAGNLLGAVKLGLLFAIAGAGVWLSAGEAAPAVARPELGGALAPAILLWFYAFTGFESPTILAAEARRPQQHLPVALLAGVGLAALLYAALLWTALVFTPDLARSSTPLASAVGRIAPPLLVPTSVLLGVLVLAALPSQFTVPPRLISSVADDVQALRLLRAKSNGVSRSAVLACAAVAVALHPLDLSALIIVSALIRLGSYAVCSFGLMRAARSPGARSAQDALCGLVALSAAALLIALAAASF